MTIDIPDREYGALIDLPPPHLFPIGNIFCVATGDTLDNLLL